MKIIHLWQDYSPNLFDKAHPLCLAHGLDSEVVCQAFIDNGAMPLPGTHFVRKRDPVESNSRSIALRVIRRLRRPIDTARFARLVRARVRMFCPDVVHLHFGTTAAALENLGALPDVPMVVSFYGADVSQSLRDAATMAAYREVFARASVLHVLCDEARQRLVDAGCASDRIGIANLPANLSDIPDIGLDPGSVTRFLIPARFVEKKGHRVLLAAFRGLVHAGAPVALTCFGYGPSDWLNAAVTEIGLVGHVQIINNGQTGRFTEEYVRLLRGHDVVLAPSIRAANGDDEGGPALTLVMAQAAGKPVIVSDFPGAERSVADGHEGRVVPAGSVGALQQAMADFVGQHALWQHCGQAGQRRVRAEFSDEAYWAQLQAWYGQCATCKPYRHE